MVSTCPYYLSSAEDRDKDCHDPTFATNPVPTRLLSYHPIHFSRQIAHRTDPSYQCDVDHSTVGGSRLRVQEERGNLLPARV